jgi:UDP-3-O-acyl-N-acetylglucosamine deacetylase
MYKASHHILDFYQNKIRAEEDRLCKFSDKKIIDINSFENDLRKQENEVHNIKENLQVVVGEKLIQKAISSQIPQNVNIEDLKTIYIVLEQKSCYQDTIQFRGKVKLNKDDDWIELPPNQSYSFIFDKNIFENVLIENMEYKITALIERSEQNWENGIIHKRYFSYITEIILLNHQDDIVHETVYLYLQGCQEFGNLIQFKGKVKLNQNDNWLELQQNNSYSFQFDKEIFKNTLQEYTEYKIKAFIKKSTKKWEKKDEQEHIISQGTIHKRNFLYVEQIEQISQSSSERQLYVLQQEKERLIASNWIRPLTDHEKQEQKKEKIAIKKQIKILEGESDTTSENAKQLEPILYELKNILKKFEELSIKVDNYFPNSMTFIQNPHYQGGYKYYELIKDIVGIDESLFIHLQKADKIGMIDIPILYERWCLLQIVKVLIEQFRFTPEKDWKRKLLAQMLNDKTELKKEIKNVSINFTNEATERKILMWYEGGLSNRKRPDFILDIESIRTKRKHRLIMDAKFKEEINIKHLIEELYHDKNYSENNKNTVFILHPDANKSIKYNEIVTPADWNHDAYYGEANMFDFKWDKDKNPNHKYGAILLSPIQNTNGYGNYLDNLQRLIGMGLQYQLEKNKNIILGNLERKEDMLNPHPREHTFCIKCGSDKIKIVTWGITRSNKGYYYQMMCNECEHNFVYFYCWNCHVRLIKNGTYFSYHSMQTLKPYDIKCPHCSKFWFQINEEHNNTEGENR